LTVTLAGQLSVHEDPETTAVVAVAELFPGFESGVTLLLADVVFVIVEPGGAVTFTTRVIVTVAPLLIVPNAQVTVPVPPGGGVTQLP
jgi:hypothetical protein